jgi:glycosyltransferase involved in cell wall biosynthesis
MRLSIVVPAFNEARLLPDTLAAIRAAADAFPAGAWELIVCDNNSTDATADLARHAGARVVFEPVNQISRARNAGAAAAGGDWLLFVDADSRPTAGLLREVASTMDDPDAVYAGARMRMVPFHAGAWLFLRLWGVLSRVNGWAAGSFLLVRRAAFEDVGGFSDALFAAEEIDLSVRLREWARARGGRFVRLGSRHPLLTSGRKLHLYSVRTHLVMLWRTLRTRGANLRNRDDCTLWYDGRR